MYDQYRELLQIEFNPVFSLRLKSLQGLNQKYAYGLVLIPEKVYQNNNFGGRANPEWAWPYLHMEHIQIELNPAHSNTFSQSRKGLTVTTTHQMLFEIE